jgi:hypothetical protein
MNISPGLWSVIQSESPIHLTILNNTTQDFVDFETLYNVIVGRIAIKDVEGLPMPDQTLVYGESQFVLDIVWRREHNLCMNMN